MVVHRVICLAGMLAAVVVMSGCGLVAKPKAKVVGVKMGKITSTAAMLIFDVEVHNPSFLPLPLVSVDYSLSTEGQKFVNGETDLQGTIPAGKSKILALPVKVYYHELLKVARGVRGKSEIPYTADIGIFVTPPAMGKLRLPMQRKGTVKLPTTQGILNRLMSTVDSK